MAKIILTNTESSAGVKISGTGASETISLNSDLLVANRLVLDGATQIVNIDTITWAGNLNSVIKISRGGADIITLLGEQPNQIVFDQLGFNESQNNTSNIVVTITGEGYLYLGLRKVSGYKQTYNPGLLGIYDNQSIADVPVNPNP